MLKSGLEVGALAKPCPVWANLHLELTVREEEHLQPVYVLQLEDARRRPVLALVRVDDDLRADVVAVRLLREAEAVDVVEQPREHVARAVGPLRGAADEDDRVADDGGAVAVPRARGLARERVAVRVAPPHGLVGLQQAEDADVVVADGAGEVRAVEAYRERRILLSLARETSFAGGKTPRRPAPVTGPVPPKT